MATPPLNDFQDTLAAPFPCCDSARTGGDWARPIHFTTVTSKEINIAGHDTYYLEQYENGNCTIRDYEGEELHTFSCHGAELQYATGWLLGHSAGELLGRKLGYQDAQRDMRNLLGIPLQ